MIVSLDDDVITGLEMSALIGRSCLDGRMQTVHCIYIDTQFLGVDYVQCQTVSAYLGLGMGERSSAAYNEFAYALIRGPYPLDLVRVLHGCELRHLQDTVVLLPVGLMAVHILHLRLTDGPEQLDDVWREIVGNALVTVPAHKITRYFLLFNT